MPTAGFGDLAPAAVPTTSSSSWEAALVQTQVLLLLVPAEAALHYQQ
jgi:hypothetical protein